MTDLPKDASLLARVGYFSLHAGHSVSPYYGLLLSRGGLSPGSIGAVATALPLATLALLPLLERTITTHDGATCAFCLCALLSSILLLAAATVSPNVYAVTNAASAAVSYGAEESSAWMVAVLVAAHCVLRAPLGTLMDTRVATALSARGFRAWALWRGTGAIAWAIGAGVIATAMMCGAAPVSAAAVVFLMGSGIGAVAVFAALTPNTCAAAVAMPFVAIPRTAAVTHAHVMRYTLHRWRIVAFLFALCVVGMGHALLDTFLFVFLDSLAAPSVIFGTAAAINVAVKIPLFQCAAAVHTYATDRELLLLAMCTWAACAFGYSLLHNPWLVLFLEFLHGLTFGLAWLAGMHFVRSAFPQTMSHTSVWFFNATAFSAAPLIGNLLGGFLYEWIGGRWLFRATACVMTGAGVAFAAIDEWLERGGHSARGEGEGECVVEAAP